MSEGMIVLTCQEVMELMSDHIEGALNFRDEIRFSTHLDQCEGCANYLDQMRVTVASLERLEVAQIPEAMMQRLFEAFQNWRNP